MTYIETVPEGEADGAVAAMYETDREVFGYLPNFTRGFSWARRDRPTVALDRDPDLDPGPQDRDSVTPGHRNPERVRLDAPGEQELPVHRQPGQ